MSAGCCESGQTGSDQDCFIVDGNIEEQISSHFQHNSGMNQEEEMEMTFSRSVYGEIGDKDIGSFHSEGTWLYFGAAKYGNQNKGEDVLIIGCVGGLGGKQDIWRLQVLTESQVFFCSN